ncbi:MAG: hypothetical protein F4X14_15410 [Caldilineaceae bacterium SB0661_bin_32]|uniref:Uncharacterized protein n=1 Tax=Caldilineaceae bacterium SB0661_bin_32 TaxID=2605255 RepID=A0A6B1D8I6_9CHLR|nr:hypothetical protein [Caldilineaceae bacterium SB0661_bin_32]
MSGKSQSETKKEKRQDQVFELTLAGKSTHEIAAKLGVDHGTTSRDLQERLQAEMRKGSEEVERHQTLQLARIQKLMSAQWPQATEGDKTPGAARIILRLMEREAMLLDQDAPKRTQHGGPDGEPEKAKKALNFRALTTEEIKQFLALLAKLQGEDDAEYSEAVA